ncbi:MAG: GAF domain-containing protein, partial [Desulfobacterales bacterium]
MIIRRLLGEILIDMGFVTEQQLDKALQKQRKTVRKKPLSKRLKRTALVSEARLAPEKAPSLGQILTELGFVTKEQVDKALKEQDKALELYKTLESKKLGIAIEMGSMVNSTLNLAEVLALIMKYVNQVTNSSASTLMLLDDKTGELVFSVPTGPGAGELTDIRIPPGEGIAGWVVENEEPALASNAADDPRFYPRIDKISGLETKSILCVPLKVKTRLIGVLEAINKEDGSVFTKEDAL